MHIRRFTRKEPLRESVLGCWSAPQLVESRVVERTATLPAGLLASGRIADAAGLEVDVRADLVGEAVPEADLKAVAGCEVRLVHDELGRAGGVRDPGRSRARVVAGNLVVDRPCQVTLRKMTTVRSSA